MGHDEDRLNRYLNEALAMERTLVSTLSAHLAMTPSGPYRRLLQRHLRETRAHAQALSERAQGQGPSLIGLTVNLAETAVGQVLTLAKGPLDLLRGGTDTEERLLKNAKDECATEALEIATYDAIEALASALGDTETALLAATHRADEERMLADLRNLIPALAGAPEEEDTLPIPDYDDLNAGQIVARLSDLTQRELAAALAYERANRNRRSIVERAQALTSQEPWPGYDDEDTQQIVAKLDAASANTVRDYESRHRRRVAILEAAQSQIA